MTEWWGFYSIRQRSEGHHYSFSSIGDHRVNTEDYICTNTHFSTDLCYLLLGQLIFLSWLFRKRTWQFLGLFGCNLTLKFCFFTCFMINVWSQSQSCKNELIAKQSTEFTLGVGALFVGNMCSKYFVKQKKFCPRNMYLFVAQKVHLYMFHPFETFSIHREAARKWICAAYLMLTEVNSWWALWCETSGCTHWTIRDSILCCCSGWSLQ